jgi:hypothetical protein
MSNHLVHLPCTTVNTTVPTPRLSLWHCLKPHLPQPCPSCPLRESRCPLQCCRPPLSMHASSLLPVHAHIHTRRVHPRIEHPCPAEHREHRTQDPVILAQASLCPAHAPLSRPPTYSIPQNHIDPLIAHDHLPHSPVPYPKPHSLTLKIASTTYPVDPCDAMPPPCARPRPRTRQLAGHISKACMSRNSVLH